jgi:acetyl-CoA C-acetyltransferase
MAERCAVIGVGQTHHKSKREDVSIAGLVREAAKMALADADLTWSDIDAVVIGKAPDMFEGNMMPEIYLAPALGAVGKPMFRVHTAGSVGGSTALVAAHLISSGIHKRVLTVAYEKQSDSDAMWALSVPQPFAAPLLAGAGGYFAPHIRAYMRRSGAPDYIGRMVAVKDRQNAMRNPYAHLHLADIDMKMVEDSMMLWDPLRYLEACPSSDGAAAMVLAAEDAVSGHYPPAWVHGMAMGPSRPCLPGATRSTLRRVVTARPTSTPRPGSRTPASSSTAPRSMCRSAGTSRCGWRTSGSATWVTAGS